MEWLGYQPRKIDIINTALRFVNIKAIDDIFISLHFKNLIMSMNSIFLQAHRGFAYLILLIAALFIVSLLAVMFGYSGKINKLLRKSTLFTMIFFHTQFLIGLVMLFSVSSFLDIVKEKGMGFIMKSAELRFSYIEHPFSMLVAAVLLTIANKKIKQNESINFAIILLSVIALALFFYAFPFGKLFQ